VSQIGIPLLRLVVLNPNGKRFFCANHYYQLPAPGHQIPLSIDLDPGDSEAVLFVGVCDSFYLALEFDKDPLDLRFDD